MSTLVTPVARFYQRSFDRHPAVTLAFTNGALNALGDSVAQSTQIVMGARSQLPGTPRTTYDPLRTFRFFCFGFGMGPLIGRWIRFLEHTFPLRAASGGQVSFKALGKRVAADQLFMAPIGLTIFISSMGVMEGRDRDHIKRKLTDLYFPALIANWKIWPLAQLINFRYMPLPYRVPFQSTCGVFWTLYLSLLNSRESKRQEREDQTRKTLD